MGGRKTIVAISGGFDPPHDKHYHYIEEALKLGDVLVVILSRNDQLVGKKGRVWINYTDRKYMLEFLLDGKKKGYKIVPNVDKDLTTRDSLKEYLPIHIFAKGGDTWDKHNLPEWDVCKELGIDVVFGVGGYHKDKGSSDIKDEKKEEL